MAVTNRVLAVLLIFSGFAFGQSSVPTTFFGMHTTSQNNWPLTLGSLGKGTEVSWEYIESAPGVYDWSRLDDWVNTAAAQGVSFIYSNDGIPVWAVDPSAISQCLPVTPGSSLLNCRAMVKHITDWDNFVTALATRYKERIIYELWNEPSANGTYLSVADMVTLTTHELNIIRSKDPTATVLCCGFVPFGNYNYMDKFYAAAGASGVDGIGFHGIFGVPVQPPEWINSAVDTVRQILGKYGLSAKPLWDTEGGWAIKSPPADKDKGPFVAKWYLLQWFKGVSRSYWMAWDSWRPLWDPTTGINKAGTAYQQVYDRMVGATMSRPCALGTDGTTWSCGFTRTRGYQGLVLWNTGGNRSYVPAVQYTQYRDLSGHTTPISPGQSIIIGLSPIILENFTP